MSTREYIASAPIASGPANSQPASAVANTPPPDVALSNASAAPATASTSATANHFSGGPAVSSVPVVVAVPKASRPPPKVSCRRCCVLGSFVQGSKPVEKPPLLGAGG